MFQNSGLNYEQKKLLKFIEQVKSFKKSIYYYVDITVRVDFLGSVDCPWLELRKI